MIPPSEGRNLYLLQTYTLQEEGETFKKFSPTLLLSRISLS
jgi:hypothetical protein